MHKTLIRQNAVSDLTSGVIWKQILIFFLPVFLGSLFQQLYNATDAVIIGHFAGKESLASIDSTSSLTRMFVNFFVGISSGATVIISQHFGAKRKEDLSQAIHTAMTFALLAGLGLSLLCTIFAPSLISIMNVPEEISGKALSYARMYFAGSVVSLVYNMGTGIMRAMGDSKTPFRYLVVCCLVNIVLDCLFVIVFRWDVFGVALATVISQGLSAVLIICKLTRLQGDGKLSFRLLGLDMVQLKKILRVGVPIGMQGVLYSITNILLQTQINGFGTNVIASWGVYGKMDSLVWMILEGFGIAASTFVAQNYGAHKTDRVRRSISICMSMSFITTAVLGALLVILARFLARIFINDADVITMCQHMVNLVAPFYCVYSISEILSGSIRGTGQSSMPMVITLLGTCVFRLVWVLYFIPRHHELDLILAVYPITWFLTSMMFIIYYLYRKKRGLI